MPISFEVVEDLSLPSKFKKGLLIKDNFTKRGSIDKKLPNIDRKPDPTLPMLYGDARRFKQVMLNLVKNSFKFTSFGSVEIKACYRSEPENVLIVQIKDSGKGIIQEEIPTIFNKFGLLQRTALNNDDGLGLGLTIVKKIVT